MRRTTVLGKNKQEEALPIEWTTPISEENADLLIVTIVSLDKQEVCCSFTLSDKEYTGNIPASAFKKSNVVVKTGDRVALYSCKTESCVLGWFKTVEPPPVTLQRFCSSCKEATSPEDWLQSGTQCPVCGEIVEWQDPYFDIKQ